MNILIHLSNGLIGEAIKQLLTGNGYEQVSLKGHGSHAQPDIILVDSSTIPDVVTLYPDAKLLLMDTGLEKEQIIKTLLGHKLYGVLSAQTELPLFQKALGVVSQGQVWIDNSTVQGLLHNSVTKNDNNHSLTEREQQVRDLVVEGYSNKQIGDKLSISENTVKVHLNQVFRKHNVTTRAKLIGVMMNGRGK